ncbi:hypothetical protein LHFGNBLO_000352 [Mesorhizobium sp. AR10]|uniref:hypothetical protein n=1 Tax=Mesorhizobium sp. AR10 TaxID=2865839 RepID=UPI002160B75D|nr:hypothetical protein [Mesorhizobium sp. AR10]UVK39038.1 hypothetical protein LHFGNBLO_000352 [Mesorhizobium sp. AR10]
MLAWLKKFFSGHRLSFMQLPEEQRQGALDAELKDVFNQSKMFSDFLAMILRLSFSFLAFVYFISKAFLSTELSHTIVFAICTCFSMAASSVMAFYIMKIVTLWASDMFIHLQGLILRTAAVVLVAAGTIVLIIGIISLIGDIAQSSSILAHAAP